MELKDQQIIVEKGIAPKKSLVQKVKDFYAAPADKPVIQDREVIDKAYPHWRLRTFYSIFLSYVVFYICRKNIAVALPVIQTEFHYTNTELGIFGSSLYFTYAIGKFVNGVLADSANVRAFLPTALIVSALANIAIVISSLLITPGEFTFFGLPAASVLLWVMAFFWGCNGWVQSMAFPSIAKSLTYWYSNKERGTKWAFWSTSHQVGTSISVIMSGFLIAHYGWRSAFIAPAIIAIFTSIFLFNRLRDKPTTLGLPDIEEYREPEVTAQKIEEEKLPYVEVFKKHILFNKTIWMLAIAYIFVYIIRYGTEDWIIKYLVEVKDNSIEQASLKLFFHAICGITGALAAGYFSDKIFKGKRAPINILFLVGIILSIVGLKLNTSIELLDYVFIGLLGLFTYGPQMLIGGLCAVESSSKQVASAATGFTGSFGYIGAIISGVGTGFAVDNYGWDGALIFWTISAVICIAICIPMWNNK